MFTLSIPLPPGCTENAARGFCDALEGLALSVSATREGLSDAEIWTLQALFDAPPEASAIFPILPFVSDPSGWRVERLPECDWLAHVHAAHPPFSVGPFFVRESGREEPSPPGSIPLIIDAVTAFGSGSHGTTKGCLEALGILAQQGVAPRSILDMGTGSGILGIAAWKLWRVPVLAVDIERESVRVACRHRSMNDVPAAGRGMLCKQGGRFDIQAIAARSPFDLILANILAAPLRAMAQDLWNALAPGGRVVLSGMLHEQADEVFAVYAACGAVMERRLNQGEWSTLSLSRP